MFYSPLSLCHLAGQYVYNVAEFWQFGVTLTGNSGNDNKQVNGHEYKHNNGHDNEQVIDYNKQFVLMNKLLDKILLLHMSNH